MGWMAEDLDVDAVHPESLEAALFQGRLHGREELLVENVFISVVVNVVEMDVLERVDVEVHLVVGAEPVLVDAQEGELRQRIVDRGDRDGAAVGDDVLPDHVGAGVSQVHHRGVDGEALVRGLEAVVAEGFPEVVHRGLVFERCHGDIGSGGCGPRRRGRIRP